MVLTVEWWHWKTDKLKNLDLWVSCWCTLICHNAVHKGNGRAPHSWNKVKQIVGGGTTALWTCQKANQYFYILEKHFHIQFRRLIEVTCGTETEDRWEGLICFRCHSLSAPPVFSHLFILHFLTTQSFCLGTCTMYDNNLLDQVSAGSPTFTLLQ